MFRRVAIVSSFAILASVGINTPTSANDFPAFSPQRKFDWAKANFHRYCKVTSRREVTFDDLPVHAKLGLVAATQEMVVQGIRDNCLEIKNAVAAR